MTHTGSRCFCTPFDRDSPPIGCFGDTQHQLACPQVLPHNLSQTPRRSGCIYRYTGGFAPRQYLGRPPATQPSSLHRPPPVLMMISTLHVLVMLIEKHPAHPLQSRNYNAFAKTRILMPPFDGTRLRRAWLMRSQSIPTWTTPYLHVRPTLPMFGIFHTFCPPTMVILPTSLQTPSQPTWMPSPMTVSNPPPLLCDLSVLPRTLTA